MDLALKKIRHARKRRLMVRNERDRGEGICEYLTPTKIATEAGSRRRGVATQTHLALRSRRFPRYSPASRPGASGPTKARPTRGARPRSRVQPRSADRCSQTQLGFVAFFLPSLPSDGVIIRNRHEEAPPPPAGGRTTAGRWWPHISAPHVYNTQSGVPPREAPSRAIDLGEVSLCPHPT